MIERVLVLEAETDSFESVEQIRHRLAALPGAHSVAISDARVGPVPNQVFFRATVMRGSRSSIVCTTAGVLSLLGSGRIRSDHFWCRWATVNDVTRQVSAVIWRPSGVGQEQVISLRVNGRMGES